ncbi:MAG: hypothetical protein ACRD2D_02945, partial [Terriglobales bacterium]
MTLPFVREMFQALARNSPLARASAAARRHEPCALGGLTPSAQLMATALLQRSGHRPVLLLVPDNGTAEEWCETLASFAELSGGDGDDSEHPLLLPGFEIDPYEGLSPHPAILEQRGLALWRSTDAGVPFLIVPAVAAATRLAAPDHYRHLAQRLRRGDLLDLEGLAQRLTEMGYQRQDPVEAPGQFSIRGGLLDVFSPEAGRPVRIELFGDEIESLREFDPATQRSVATELHDALLVSLTSLPLSAELQQKLGGGTAPGWEFQVPGLLGYAHSVFDLMEKPLVVVSEPEALRNELERWWRRLRQRSAMAPPGAPAPESIFWTPEEFAGRLGAAAPIELRELAVEELDLSAEALEIAGSVRAELASIVFSSRPVVRPAGSLAELMQDYRAQLQGGERLLFLGANPGEVERLADLFTEYRLPFQFGVRPLRAGSDFLAEKAYYSSSENVAVLAEGSLLRGFSLPAQHFTILG